MRLDQQTQAGFHRGFLRTRAAASHGLTHQAVIDVDIRSQKVFLLVCKYVIIVCIKQVLANGHGHGLMVCLIDLDQERPVVTLSSDRALPGCVHASNATAAGLADSRLANGGSQ